MPSLEVHDDAGSRETDVPLHGGAAAHRHGHASQGCVLGLDGRSRSGPARAAAIPGTSEHGPGIGAGNVMLRIRAAGRVAMSRWCPSGRPAR